MHPSLVGLNLATEERETHLFFGQIQSGKTHMLLSACHQSQQVERLTLFLIPNLCTGWYGQLVHRIELFNESPPYHQHPLRVSYVGDKEESELNKIVKQDPSHVFVCLANPSQLGMAMRLVEDHPFNLLIDEADQMYKEEHTVFRPLFQRLVDQALWTGVISATTYKLWFQAPILTTFTHKLEASPHYKGLPEFVTELTSKSEKYVSLSQGEVNKCDLSFTSWVEDLLAEQPYEYHVKMGGVTLKKKMPVMGLYKGSNEIRVHHHIQTYTKKHYPQLTTLTYDSHGICLYSPSLEESFLWMGREVVKRKNNKYISKKASLGEVLQCLKDNGGADRFPHILIISGKLANRMFSFVSKDYEWHLTHQRLYMPPSTDCTTLLQSVRLCGVYKDDVPLVLSCSVSIYEALMKADQFQKTMIELAMDDQRNVWMQEFVKEQHVEKKEIPKKPLVAGYSYNKEIGVVEPEVVEDEDPSDRGLTLMMEKIQEKWHQRGMADAPIYLKIIDCFDKQDEMSKTEIIQQTRLSNFSHYTKWNLKRHNQYKLLVKTGGSGSNTMYQLHPSVLEWMGTVK